MAEVLRSGIILPFRPVNLVGDATITGIRFWTFEAPGEYNGGTLLWKIYNDVSGIQGTLVGSGSFTLSNHMMGGVSVAGYDTTEYQNDFTIPNLAIAVPNSRSFFLDISDPSKGDTFGIFWATSGQDVLAFQLLGTGNVNTPAVDPTPEPATFALLGSGVIFLLARSRKLKS